MRRIMMDKIRTSQPLKPLNTWALKIVPILLLAFFLWIFFSQTKGAEVSASQLIYGKVQKGDLNVSVNGYGTLRSTHQKLISSHTGGTVEEILLRPGALVEHDSIILKLSNPTLVTELESAHQLLTQEQANLRKLKLDQKRELLEEKSKLIELKSRHAATVLTRDAQLSLKEKGIIPLVQYKQIENEVEMIHKQINIFQERMDQLLLVHKEAINIQEEIIRQTEGTYQTQFHKVESLHVKAGMNGVLQRLPVEPGQTILAGGEVALVGSIDKLTAELKVAQTQAEKIKIGQSVIIDTRQDKISGEVFRIDPSVENGTVLIEISLFGELPSSARPQLNIDGQIIVGVYHDTLFVERPVNATEKKTANVFVVDANSKYATATEIEFGLEAGKYIQVLSGASVTDKLILSDLSIYENIDKLTLQ